MSGSAPHAVTRMLLEGNNRRRLLVLLSTGETVGDSHKGVGNHTRVQAALSKPKVGLIHALRTEVASYRFVCALLCCLSAATTAVGTILTTDGRYRGARRCRATRAAALVNTL